MLNTLKHYLILTVLIISACGLNQTGTGENNAGGNTDKNNQKKLPIKPKTSPLQAEILDKQNGATGSPLGKFDFQNFTYPLPRGWQDVDSKDITLENGRRPMTEEKIGMEYVTAKYFDVTGDGEDEAFVILKILTGSITITQVVYIFEWNTENPELIWYFRTGDRSDGGLKRIYPEDGGLAVELFGKDRYLFNQMETSKIVGDEQPLCCPTHFTKTFYKYEGNRFVLKGDRWTYSLKDKSEEPVKNMNELKLEEERGA